MGVGEVALIYVIAPFSIISFISLRMNKAFYKEYSPTKEYDENVAIGQAVKIFAFYLAILFLVNIWGAYFGDEEIGSFIEKEEYTSQYYVMLFPNSSHSKNYYLPADIRAENGSYYVEKVYFPNGGYKTFSQWEGIKPNEKCTIYDDSDKDWDVILTTNKPFKKVE